jgi:hypothetical protein
LFIRRLSSALATGVFAAVTASAQTPAPPPATTTPAPFTAEQEARLLKLGHTYTMWMITGMADSLASAFDAKALESIGGIDGVRERTRTAMEHAGLETIVVVEKMTRRRGQPQFWHEGKFTGLADDNLVIRWILDIDTGKIVGAGMGPKAGTPAPDN